MYDKKFMDQAIRLAKESVRKGVGGPFGAVIVKNGEVVAACSNSVTSTNDPTAHAEINAIRKACACLNTYQLSGCDIYTSCEPCPMCLGAIYWARLERVYYASTQMDAADAGFDDSFIYREILLSPHERSIPFLHHRETDAGKEFELWKSEENKMLY